MQTKDQYRSIFDFLINRIRRREQFAPGYKLIPINLDNGLTEQEFSVSGGYLEVIAATDALAEIRVRFNESTADQITLQKDDKVITPFYRLFISAPVQAGKTLTLAVAPDEDAFRIIRGSITRIEGAIATSTPEEVDLRQGRVFHHPGTTTVASGNFMSQEIENPVDSGVNLHVRLLAVVIQTGPSGVKWGFGPSTTSVVNQSSTTVELAPAIAGGTAPLARSFLRTYGSSVAMGNRELGRTSNAMPVGSFVLINAPEVIVPPGHSFMVPNLVANMTHSAIIRWREVRQ